MANKTHVPKQLHGYSLQFTECLSVLLDAGLDDFVSVEVLDDVALSSEGTITLIQTKAGTGANPVSDGAVELWKTIRNWIDQINNGEIDPLHSTFTLYVGASHKGNLCSAMNAAKNSAEIGAVIQKIRSKFVTPATKRLKRTLGKEIRQQIQVVLDQTNRAQLELIISRFDYRSGSAESYADLQSRFSKMAVQDSLLELMMDRMAGWVKRQIDTAIEMGKDAIISVEDFRKELISYHVKLINQPFLERFAHEVPKAEYEEHKSRIYYRQLILIEADDNELMEAVGYYLSACAHAVRYCREGIINSASLDEYAADLRTLWTQLKKKWELQGSTKGDVHFGKSLLNDCSLQRTKIQGGDVPTSFMCGSFHGLADELEIGWHPKYLQLLRGTDGAV